MMHPLLPCALRLWNPFAVCQVWHRNNDENEDENNPVDELTHFALRWTIAEFAHCTAQRLYRICAWDPGIDLKRHSVVEICHRKFCRRSSVIENSVVEIRHHGNHSLFDYVFSASLPSPIRADNSVVWSRSALSPLAPGLLTPFSYSMLAEIVRRGWYTYYDSLGCEPPPGARLVRQHAGRAYLNLSICAGLDAQLGIEPLALRINGERQALAAWSKPGLLGGLLNRPQRKVDKALDTMAQALAAATTRSQKWHEKTEGLRWSQAEILQVMEEIERVGVDSLSIFFAARHNLMLLYHRILWATDPGAPFPQNLALLQGALRALPNMNPGKLVESELAAAVAQLGNAFAPGSGDDAQPPQLDSFLQQYGHRTLGEGEVRQPRWNEDAALIRASAQACARRAEASTSPTVPGGAAPDSVLQPLLEIAGNQQNEVRGWLEQVAQLMQLQSQALHAYAYVLAGTRRWALAAAQEAMSDGRIKSQDDVFFFELEQVKEMMTGEWNISSAAEIHAHVQQQREHYAEWQQQDPSDLLIGDVASESVSTLPGSPGSVTGTFFPAPALAEADAAAPILGSHPFDGGGAALFPAAGGIIGVDAAPLDPVVAAACIAGTPCVLVPGAHLRSYSPGSLVALNGERGTALPEE